MLAKNKIDRKESRVYSLIDNVDESLNNKVNSEELAVFVESVGGLLNSEACDLDTDIDDLAIFLITHSLKCCVVCFSTSFKM